MKKKLDEAAWRDLQYDERTYTKYQAKRNMDKDIVIPDTYRFIGNEAFMGNERINSVTLPRGCIVIGKSAFEGCCFQKEVKYPNTLLWIRQRAFSRNNRLRRVHIPPSVAKIDKNVYKECKKLYRAEFARGSKCRAIPEGMFDCCGRLSQVVLPDEIQLIGRRAFYRCKELQELHFPQSLKIIDSEAFYFTGIQKLILPNQLRELGEAAFFKCNNLTEVSIPSSVKKIGKWVFHGCNRLTVVEILHDPIFIGEWIINRSATIRCRKGSAVEEYGKEYGFKMEFIDDSQNDTAV